jgi:hypothetical protein
MQGIASASATKPSFLLWEKVYQKITAPEEELWLLRALESVAVHMNGELAKNEQLRCVPSLPH